MRRGEDRVVGWLVGGTVFAQGVVLALMTKPGARGVVQLLAVAAALGGAAMWAWRVRGQLDHRVDMALIMASFGGLGMQLGWWLDHLRRMPAPGERLYPSVWHAVFSLMTLLMLAAAVPASVRWTRCARLARQSRRRWVTTHLVGNAAMIAGMIAGGRLWGAALGALAASPKVGHHVAMVIGMVVGMHLGMWVGEAVAGLQPWRREVVPLE
jgi:hypothetical protein